ncbi:MAG: S26 family signal peptidase [Planctomycetaceae bacterium]|nr:S26 family signal peptidase [Planctomycetaceae bacterium]
MKTSDSDTPQKDETVSTFHSTREFIEALGIALILAFFFKAFVIELYAIPTGSMASTLMGRHKDINCVVCNFPFQLSASSESNDGQERPLPKDQLPKVVAGTCPQCQFTMYVGDDNFAGEIYMSYGGDRIFVNRSLFSFRNPSRWHVTVFRFPAQPQTNYIKRLIGVENETVKIRNGQVFAKKDGSEHFEIQRKPLRVLHSLLRPVDDNDHVVPEIHELGWNTRWYSDSPNWQRSEDYKSFSGTNSTDEISWLKFRYITATTEDWRQLLQGRLPGGDLAGRPQLITDSLDYNSYIASSPHGRQLRIQEVESVLHGTTLQTPRRNMDRNSGGIGLNWVGDLVVQCTLHADKAEGVVSFRLVKGGINFRCDIDLSARTATFSIPGVPEFEAFSVNVPMRPGRNHAVMFCNVDEEMRLVIDGREIDTQGRGRYDSFALDGSLLCRNRRPTVLDLEPAAIGFRDGGSIRVANLKILRNMYYIASDTLNRDICDLELSPFQHGFSEENVKRVLSSPEFWGNFGKTRQRIFELGPDQFLMCGDNSAQSLDSRLWTSYAIPHYVHREHLIGEAMFVFWPHGIRIPGTRLAVIPNIPKMRWIN